MEKQITISPDCNTVMVGEEKHIFVATEDFSAEQCQCCTLLARCSVGECFPCMHNPELGVTRPDEKTGLFKLSAV